MRFENRLRKKVPLRPEGMSLAKGVVSNKVAHRGMFPPRPGGGKNRKDA